MYELEIDSPDPSPLSWGMFDLSLVEDLSDAELDELPFGVICLDPDGLILRYNLAESRLARLDRAHVLGKNFFRQVARCTARPEFQGRVEAFLRAREGDPVEHRFPFLFDFKFGAQLVTIELVRPRTPSKVYLLVNRDQMMPLRPDAEEPAPALADLEGAPPPGVLRDGRAERYVRLGVAAFQGLYAAAVRAGADGQRLFREWGVEWGRVAILDLETLAAEERGASLRSMTMGDALGLCARLFREQGWGDLTVDLGPAPRVGALVVRVERSALLEGLRCPVERRHGFIEGYLQAIFSSLAGRKLAAHHAAAPGDDLLTPGSFVVVDVSRSARVLELLRGEPRGVDALLDRLATELPS